MNIHQVLIIALIVVLTLISGLADAQGFLHAANTWNNGTIVWSEGIKALSGFITGAVSYILVINYLKQVGIVVPELQTMIWFIVAMLSVAIVSGKFLQWQRIDQGIAVIAIVCVGWLVIHHG